eukprot:1159050-Pelagomonas_calceolata.AAC.2
MVVMMAGWMTKRDSNQVMMMRQVADNGGDDGRLSDQKKLETQIKQEMLHACRGLLSKYKSMIMPNIKARHQSHTSA